MIGYVWLSFLLFSSLAGADQCLRVLGQLSCPPPNQMKSKFVYVRLVDHDSSSTDDIMDTGYTASSGSFQLHGCASDPIGNIDPELHIYHTCKLTADGKPQHVLIEIPVSFLEGNYNATINLGNIVEQKKTHPKTVIEGYTGSLKPTCD